MTARKKNPMAIVLSYKGITVRKDSYCFRVTGGKTSIKYYPKLPDALLEVSDRVRNLKLLARNETGETDILSLTALLREQHNEMMELLKSMGVRQDGKIENDD